MIASTPAASRRVELGRIVDRPRPDGRAHAVRALDACCRHDRVMEHQRRRADALDHRRHARDDRPAQGKRAEADRRLKRALPRDAVTVFRVGEADLDRRRARGHGAEALPVEGADDGSLDEAVPLEGVHQLVEASRQLQVDVQCDVSLGQEGERFVQRRELRSELAQLGERPVTHCADRSAVADLREVVRVGEHERATDEVEHVELDRVDAVRERHLERTQRVLGRKRRGAAVPDADQRPVFSQKLHGAVGRRSSSSSPPRAAYLTIIRSVTHSTGARSSVHGRFAFFVTGRIWRASSSRSGRRAAGPLRHELAAGARTSRRTQSGSC